MHKAQHRTRSAQVALAVLCIGVVTQLAGCGKPGAAAAKPLPATQTQPAEAPLLLAAEDFVAVGLSTSSAGPVISGSVEPERLADLRAEVAAVVLQVLKDNGDVVRRGDLLVRLDDTAIRDSLNSAEASAKAAGQAYDQAERQLQRLSQLRASGVVSVQAFEDVEIRRNNAQSDLEAAKSRAALARQQLQRTQVHAPFDGIVSERQVSAGDTAQIGKELLKVIDPHSLRFAGRVAAAAIGDVHVDQRVAFRVHGYRDQTFAGRVTRVNPAANSVTRQVEVLVEFEGQAPTVAGLYAEGRIETRQTGGLMLPASALVEEAGGSFVWRVANSALTKTRVQVASRDARSGDFLVIAGLAAGERVLRYPNAALRDGRPVEIAVAALAGPR
jgi:membrane fusion protein, multidrug efflux system